MDKPIFKGKWVGNYKCKGMESSKMEKEGKTQDDLESYAGPGVEVGWKDVGRGEGFSQSTEERTCGCTMFVRVMTRETMMS